MKGMIAIACLLAACAPAFALHMQDAEGTVYQIAPAGISITLTGSGVRMQLPSFVWPSFERQTTGSVLAAIQTRSGVKLLAIDPARESHTVIRSISGARQPLLAGGSLLYLTDDGRHEQLWYRKGCRSDRVPLARFDEIGGFAAAERDGRVAVAVGAVVEGVERIYLVARENGRWSDARAISPSGQLRTCPEIIYDGSGRLVVACLGVGEGGSRIYAYTEAQDGTFEETAISYEGEQASPPLLVEGSVPVVIWPSSGGGAHRVLGAALNERPVVREISRLSSPAALTKLDGKLFLGPDWILELDPDSMERWSEHQPPPRPNRAAATANYDVYVGFGDSIMEGNRDTGSDDNCFYPYWRGQLALAYGTAEVHNEGKGGEVTANGVYRLPNVIERRSPGVVCIMEGTNDITRRHYHYTSTITADNLRRMVADCRAIGAVPIVSNLIPRTGRDEYDPRNHDTRRWNKAIRAMVDSEGVAFIAMYRVFTRTQNWQDVLMDDSTHPSKQGYQVMGEKWLAAIMANRPAPPPPPE
ncbi:MAG: SGNH/GDSL hydrolase family protein [Acidobacteriota bacterium]